MCHSPTRFDAPVPHGPHFTCGLAWTCDACQIDVLELIPHGPAQPRFGHCLNCDGKLDGIAECTDCGVHPRELVERVRRHCGLPPRIDAIEALRESGLYRVALNAVHLRLLADPDDVEALALCGRLLLELHRPAPALPFLRRAAALGATSN